MSHIGHGSIKKHLFSTLLLSPKVSDIRPGPTRDSCTRMAMKERACLGQGEGLKGLLSFNASAAYIHRLTWVVHVSGLLMEG